MADFRLLSLAAQSAQAAIHARQTTNQLRGRTSEMALTSVTPDLQRSIPHEALSLHGNVFLHPGRNQLKQERNLL
jgi:hypothetical protein